MIEKQNRWLLGIIALLLLVCLYVLRQKGYANHSIFALLVLEGALASLFWKEKKWWAIWCAIGLLFFWSMGANILPLYKRLLGGMLFLVSGCLAIYRYHTTGWESYVMPGCFAILFALFGFAVQWITVRGHCGFFFLCCLLLAGRTAHQIKQKKKPMKKVWIECLVLFSIAGICFL